MAGKIKDISQLMDVWSRFRTGDQHAFAIIYEEFVDILFDYGKKITNDRELVKDSIHDLFLDLYRYNPLLKRPHSLEFYLYRSLRNLIVNKLKKSSHFETLPANESGPTRFRLFLVEEFPDNDSISQLIPPLLMLIESLDEKKREMLYLKFNTGLSYAEIGDLLEMNAESC